MNVIDSYLDTLFAPYPDSPRLREAKAELRTMMEDSYQGLREDGLSESQAVGRVIADFGTLEEVAPALGISTELGGGIDPVAGTQPAAPPRLELERARAYAEAVHRSQWTAALGICLFVLAAVPLLLLIAIDGHDGPEPSLWAVGAGITCVLVTVGLGVLLLGVREARLGDYEDINEGDVTPSTEVISFARQLRRDHKRSMALSTGAAIMLWILCALPTVFFSLAAQEGSVTPLYGVSMTLVLVALGLWIMIRAGWPDEAASKLLQEPEEDEDSPEVSSSPVIRAVAALYWPVAAAAYLAWSFLSGDWGISWIIWPVAGVLYAGLWSLSVAIGPRNEDSSRRTGARRA